MDKPKVEVRRWDRDPRPAADPGSRPDGTGSQLRNVEALAWLLDASIPIPGFRFRIGLDGLLGLLPGIGDFIGAALSSYILIVAAKLGVPRVTLMRMGFNVTLEAVVGLVPFAGDLFDFAWKANLRNVALLRAHMADPMRAKKGDWLFAGLFILGVVALVAGFGFGTMALGRFLGGLFAF